jgi:hypothetical protein
VLLNLALATLLVGTLVDVAYGEVLVVRDRAHWLTAPRERDLGREPFPVFVSARVPTGSAIVLYTAEGSGKAFTYLQLKYSLASRAEVFWAAPVPHAGAPELWTPVRFDAASITAFARSRQASFVAFFYSRPPPDLDVLEEWRLDAFSSLTRLPP